jgi:hypothetical protein
VTLRIPFDTVNKKEQDRQGIFGLFTQESKSPTPTELVDGVSYHNARPPLSFIECFQTQNLVGRCWAPKPESRPTFVQIEDELLAILNKSRISTTVSSSRDKTNEDDRSHHFGLSRFFSFPDLGAEFVGTKTLQT